MKELLTVDAVNADIPFDLLASSLSSLYLSFSSS
jgi:hypothetical protein